MSGCTWQTASMSMLVTCFWLRPDREFWLHCRFVFLADEMVLVSHEGDVIFHADCQVCMLGGVETSGPALLLHIRASLS